LLVEDASCDEMRLGTMIILRQVARGIFLGYSDKWITTRFNVRVAQVKATKARHDFQTYLDETANDRQDQMRGGQRCLAVKTLTAPERLLDADDLITVNLDVERGIQLITQGFMHDP
jgi:hypothetical protein